MSSSLNRSQQMSRMRAENTGPEKRLRSALWSAGLRYRIHFETPVGRPDVVFPGKKVALFIDGCFWHGCPLHYVRPCSRADFWSEKLRANVERDRKQTLELESLGWTVLRIWEHAIYEEIELIVDKVLRALKGGYSNQVSEWRVVEVEEIDRSSRQERRYLEQLRDSNVSRFEEGRRITAKWRRPKS